MKTSADTLKQLEISLHEISSRMTYPYNSSDFYTWMTRNKEVVRICNQMVEFYGNEGDRAIKRVEQKLKGSSKGALMVRNQLASADDLFQCFAGKLMELDASELGVKKTGGMSGEGSSRMYIN